jgi:excisionase family DNA binding protein
MPDTMPIEPTALYTAAEAARWLRLPDEKTVRRMALAGTLKAVRVGQRTVRFLGADLLAYATAGGAPVPHAAVPDQVRRRHRLAS